MNYGVGHLSGVEDIKLEEQASTQEESESLPQSAIEQELMFEVRMQKHAQLMKSVIVAEEE